MGQYEIIFFLKEQYNQDKNKWFSPNEILQGLKENGHSGGENRIHICLMQLATYKIIKFKGIGLWEHRKVFRYG